MGLTGALMIAICAPAWLAGTVLPVRECSQGAGSFGGEPGFPCEGYSGTMAVDSVPFASFFDAGAKPAESLPCFPGAYYRKIVSGTGKWLGVEGTVVLPDITFDEDRKNPAKPGQYLDNPSVYLGGNMNGQETDIGLSWSVTRDREGHVSKQRNAFRPFFRRSSHGAQDPIWINAPAEAAYYWYPGEEVQLSLLVVAAGKVNLTVKGAGKTYEAVFDCAGYVPGDPGSFKRVNAIDQVGNEGKAVQPTKTKVSGAVWKETSLYGNYHGRVVLVPFSDKRYTDMRCPAPGFFRIKSTAAERNIGAEQISISGSGF